MNHHDLRLKRHKLLNVADQFEYDRETREFFADLNLPDEWFLTQAENIRRLAYMIVPRDGDALH